MFSISNCQSHVTESGSRKYLTLTCYWERLRFWGKSTDTRDEKLKPIGEKETSIHTITCTSLNLTANMTFEQIFTTSCISDMLNDMLGTASPLHPTCCFSDDDPFILQNIANMLFLVLSNPLS